MMPVLSRLHARKKHLGSLLLLVFVLALALPLPGLAMTLLHPTAAVVPEAVMAVDVAEPPCESQQHHAVNPADPADSFRCHGGGCLQCSHCPTLLSALSLPLQAVFIPAPVSLPMAGESRISRLDRPPKSLFA